MNKLSKNRSIFLFLLFFFIFLVFGLSFTFVNDIILQKRDIIFQLDPFLAYPYFWNTSIITNNLIIHPLVLIIVYPVLNFINALLQSQLASTIVLQASLASVNACFIYKIIKLISKSDKFAVFGSLIYAFSFSTILFTSVPENYIFGAFFNILLLYYVCIKLFDRNKDLTIKDYFILSFLSVLSCGFILICLVQNVILIAYLIYKKYGFNSKALVCFTNVIGFIFFLLFTLIVIQNYFYAILKFPTIEMIQHDHKKYLNLIGEDKLYHVIRGSFIIPFYAIKCVGKVWDLTEGIYAFDFVKDLFLLRCLPALVFLGGAFLYYCKKFKDIKNNNIISILLFLFLLNLVYNYIYDSAECYIFAQNFLPYLIIALMSIMSCSKNKFFEILCTLFLGYQIITNTAVFCQLGSMLKIETQKSTGIYVWIIYSFVLTLVLALVIFASRKITRGGGINVTKIYFTLCALYLTCMLICALLYTMFAVRGF